MLLQPQWAQAITYDGGASKGGLDPEQDGLWQPPHSRARLRPGRCVPAELEAGSAGLETADQATSSVLLPSPSRIPDVAPPSTIPTIDLVHPLTAPPIPKVLLMEPATPGASESQIGGHKLCMQAVKQAEQSLNFDAAKKAAQDTGGSVPFAGKPMPVAPEGSKASAALVAAGAGWGPMFDLSITAFDALTREQQSKEVPDFPASQCSLFEPASTPPTAPSKSPLVEALIHLGRNTSRSFLAGLAEEAARLCSSLRNDKPTTSKRSIVAFVPPGTDSAVVRRVVAAAAAEAHCTAESPFGQVYLAEDTGLITAAAAADREGQDMEDAEWARRGPASTEEVLAKLAAKEEEDQPRAMIMVDAMRRALNPFRAAAVLRLAVREGAPVVVAERLSDTLSTAAGRVDVWRVAPDGLGFLLKMGVGTPQRCGYVSSRTAVVAMGSSKAYDPSSATSYGAREWGGLEGASKQGRPAFGAFVLGTWYAFHTPARRQEVPEAARSGEWDTAGFDARVEATLGSGGQGLARVRSRCVSLSPRADAPWLRQFARGVEGKGLPKDVTVSPGAMLKEVWFTRFGWYFNLLSLLQAVPKCGRVLMVSSHESLIPKMLRSASCSQLACRPQFDNVDWPKMDIQRLDDALASKYIKGGVGGYDMVVLDQVLEHVPHLMRATESVRQLLKPGGTAIIAMPATNPVHHGPMDMWRAQLDGMLVVGAAIGRIDGCGTAVAPRYQAELAAVYPNIYKFPLKDPDLLAMAADEPSFAGAPPDGSMASTAWVVATRD